MLCCAVLCSCYRAINEEMKLAATHAIAALAKRPVMKRRPSAGDLLKLAGPHQGPVAAGAGAPAKQDAATAATDAAGAGAAHANGVAAADAQPNGSPAAAAAGKADSTVSSSTLSTDTAATAGVSGSEVSSSAAPPSPSRQQHHARSGSTGRGSGHLRRKSYGRRLRARHLQTQALQWVRCQWIVLMECLILPRSNNRP